MYVLYNSLDIFICQRCYSSRLISNRIEKLRRCWHVHRWLMLDSQQRLCYTKHRRSETILNLCGKTQERRECRAVHKVNAHRDRYTSRDRHKHKRTILIFTRLINNGGNPCYPRGCLSLFTRFFLFEAFLPADDASSHARWWAGDEPTPLPHFSQTSKDGTRVAAGYSCILPTFPLAWVKIFRFQAAATHLLVYRPATFISFRLQFTTVFEHWFRNDVTVRHD